MVGVSIMGDRGFTIRYSLSKLSIELKSPPFIAGRGQLLVHELKTALTIASFWIHMEQAIGRIRHFNI